MAVLRASTKSGGLEPPEAPEFDENSVAWLAEQWRNSDLREAIAYASPALHRQLDEILAAGSHDERAVRRVVTALAAYILRWQQRPTPFGLFAGIGSVRVGTTAKVRWGPDHKVTVRTDSAWLGDVLVRLHQCLPLLERLSVVVNDAAFHRGDRFVAPGPPPGGANQELAPVEVSVKYSRPVRAAVEAARTPVRFGVLRELLMTEFSSATAQQINGLLTGLLDQRILISSLLAPMTCPDALGHVCAELNAVEAETIPEIASATRELTAIHHQLSANGRKVVSDKALTSQMHALSSVSDMPVIADTILDCDVEIPEQVVHEVRDAVHVLHRLSPYPLGYPAWRDYHSRFRSRYGIGALVPVLDLVADSGLGLPADYLGSSRGRAPSQLTERDEKLLAIIQRATLNGSDEIVLTDPLIEDLVASDPTDVHLPTRVEMAVEVRAQSTEALSRGRFTLAVTGTPRPGSSMAGRFAHLLPAEGRDAVAASFTAAGPHAITAQLSFTPRKRRNENLVRSEQLVPHVIPIAEYQESAEHLITLSDLAVSADDRRFHLVQISTGRRVEPRVTHALEASVQTPPLARFLADITTARASVYKAFHFGAAARLPYLPRVRYRRTILSPARWLLAVGDLPGRGATFAEWEAGLDAWRQQWRVPDWVAMVELDRRQPVDLSHSLHRLLLRNRLNRSGRLELREASSPEDNAWLGRRHEVLIPLFLDQSSAGHEPALVTGPRQVVASNAGHLPGDSPILCAQLHGHSGRFDEILTERLARLVGAFSDEDRPSWWFRRHRQMSQPDADQYLVLYLRLPGSSSYGPAVERLSEWVNGLRAEHLLSHFALVTYEPQAGRFGEGTALDRAYDVFAADSAAALAQINLAVRAGANAQAVAAASFVDLAVNFADSVEVGSEWLIHQLRREHGPLDPALRDRTLGLADPDGTLKTLRSLPGGTDVVTAWHNRAVALRAYREALADQRDPLTVLSSLLHLHHNRSVGVDPVIERVTGRLARACALRYNARRVENQ
ncbi:lantibiotic dehydratase [Lentzea sp. BCCO 10_0856]|uniref:Lantibiotic dehydratase n=1 Tax=Lentzea miocenica TaxID=3095431 RepID=A0ABU4TFH4_9PSEU|nr:lantibiotic dehydratase [Lentzea sp. BCCO 10_0856]MDX8036929.1 lantibiotic dehydratase [Lentzea sp. BCCO 10_0856]